MPIMEITIGREKMRLDAFDKTKSFPKDYWAASPYWNEKNGRGKTRLEEYQDRQEQRVLRQQAKMVRAFMKNANTAYQPKGGEPN